MKNPLTQQGQENLGRKEIVVSRENPTSEAQIFFRKSKSGELFGQQKIFEKRWESGGRRHSFPWVGISGRFWKTVGASLISRPVCQSPGIALGEFMSTRSSQQEIFADNYSFRTCLVRRKVILQKKVSSFSLARVAIVFMDPARKFSALLLLLGFVSVLVNASSFVDDYGHCERVVQKWAFSSLEEEAKEDKHTLRDLLFFLHVPRTGGRTYFHCFLRKLYPSSLECPRSYDKLRFDPRKRKCRLLVTHDDYSMMSKLPKRRTSMVTILRDPVDRIFSTYEFSVEVAARFLVHPNLTSATQMAGRVRAKTSGVSTLDIWPWKYLVPWMREDLFARRDARKLRGLNDIMSSDPYDMSEMVMPLQEYIQNSIAHEIIHNGATFQVAGLTNNSYTPESHEVRQCVQKHVVLGDLVLQVAKKRLDDMLYVGLTEEHRESATMFANVVGSQVISQLRASSSSTESTADDRSARSSSASESKSNNSPQQKNASAQNTSDTASSENDEVLKENITVGDLMDVYEVCISSLRKTQTQRRASSLKRISPANFTKEARHQVSKAVLQQIRLLNQLDLELYKYAQGIFAKQHRLTVNNFVGMEKFENMFNNSYGMTLGNFLLIGMILVSLLFFVIVNARRRTSKVKI